MEEVLGETEMADPKVLGMLGESLRNAKSSYQKRDVLALLSNMMLRDAKSARRRRASASTSFNPAKCGQ